MDFTVKLLRKSIEINFVRFGEMSFTIVDELLP